MSNKIIIIGGVAGGATTAARLRRLDEFADIVLLERGEYISFANCGLPYHVGGVIESRDALVVQTVTDMKNKFNIDVRNFSEAIKIDTNSKVVQIKDLKTGKVYTETYDKVVLSTGSVPVKPRIPGIEEAKTLFTLRNIPDMDQIIAYINSEKPKHATVIGGGFIGIEMMENLHHLGLKVSLVEMAPQVMGMFDYEMAQIIHQNIANQGVELILNDGVKSFDQQGKQITLSSGKVINTDLIIFAIGVRPDNALAKEAGLALSDRGSVKVNEYMLTSNPDIYAIGDVVEVPNRVSNQMMMAALAGPANRQGRIVANHICGIQEAYQGTLATSAAKIFDQTVSSTGLNEKQVKNLGWNFKVLHIHPSNHASYYPGSEPISLKVIFNPETEEIYGAQAIGGDGVDKRIDVLATAIFAKVKITDLKNIDLAYAPPYSSAKDPVNMVGYVAENMIKGLTKVVTWHEIQELAAKGAYILDIRENAEVLINYLSGSVHVPLSELRSRLGELPKTETIYVYCQVGTRGYTAQRILSQHGFNAINLDGGFKSFSCVFDANGSEVCFFPVNELGDPVSKPVVEETPVSNKSVVVVDACGLQCPGPIMKVYQTMEGMQPGEMLEVKASDPGFMKDIQTWATKTGNTLVNIAKENKTITAKLQKGKPVKAEKEDPKNGSTIVVFSEDLDKAIAAFIIATGAKSMGKDVSLFFTFWGLNILRKPKHVRVKKSFIEKMFGFMMPKGTEKLPISKMNMLGMGPKMIRYIMKKKNVDSLQTLMNNAMSMGVKITACAMSMDIMGIKKEELIDGIEIAGVATYLGDTQSSNHNLFI
ncbi:CoA-disulfide reductase [Paracholeplasma manati]|uniref:CoA-disulfide reductase n=1 Tax=Paracholeplasma manati TaxID=591373 RepID=A0ABT2Y5Y4_9MOLU|nr:CoA-disulfide reductase [Paracholeplasma manati]MCV2232151.1 CoA-disulfide reductase [Paracholeplasma manati]MDG0888108.1 CoA-disulfide reductase [Paracholeplasma manati]